MLNKAILGFLILLLALSGGCSSRSNSQACMLSMQQMPALNGLKLGTKLDDVRNRFTELEIPKTDSYIQISLSNSLTSITEKEDFVEDPKAPIVNFVFDENKHSDLADVEKIRLYAFQDELYGIGITYSNKPGWKQMSSFSSHIAETLNFPYTAKTVAQNSEKESDHRLVTCSPLGEGSLSQNSDLTMYFRRFNGENFPVASIWERDRFLAFAKFLTESVPTIKSSVPPIAANSSATDSRAVVITQNANVRKSNNANSEVIVTVPLGKSIEIIKQEGPWFLIRDGKISGWIHGDMIRHATPTAESPKLSATGSTVNQDEVTKRKYAECVRQREAFGVDTAPCAEWAKER